MFSQSSLNDLCMYRAGLIAVDEHTTVLCMIQDVTPGGLYLTLLDGAEVPGTFVLLVGSGMRVCSLVRRSDEEIQAAFVEPAQVAGAAAVAGGIPRLDWTSARRPLARERILRQAA